MHCPLSFVSNQMPLPNAHDGSSSLILLQVPGPQRQTSIVIENLEGIIQYGFYHPNLPSRILDIWASVCTH